ncbi:MAG: FtsK/SpoIIIE domain-containing protein, partial [Chthoniobacterales bacterium]
MNDARRIDVAHGLELFGNLGRVIDEFSTEERKLTIDLRAEERSLEQRRDSANEHTRATTTRDLEEARERFAVHRQSLIDTHSHRRDRIETFRRETLRLLPQRSQAERERWLGDLQMRHFARSRELDAERDAAEQHHAAATTELSQQRNRLQRLQGRTRDSFTGFLGYLWRLWRVDKLAPTVEPADLTPDKIDTQLETVEGELTNFRNLPLPRLLSFFPLAVALAVIAFLLFVFLRQTEPPDPTVPYLIAAAIAAVLLIIHVVARIQSRAHATALLAAVARARALLTGSKCTHTTARDATLERIAKERADLESKIENKWERADFVKSEFETHVRRRLDTHVPRALTRNDAALETRLAKAQKEEDEQLPVLESNARQTTRSTETEAERTFAEFEADRARRWNELLARWDAAIGPLYAEAARMNEISAEVSPPWTPEFVAKWDPPSEFLPVTQFARLEVDLASDAPATRLTFPGSTHLAVPLALAYPETGSLLFETSEPVDHSVISCLNQIILRLLATTPPGKLTFTILDPVGLGQNFAGIMHLGDYEDSLITRRIWTQTDQIEERLADLNTHIEKVIQMYLRDEFPTIADYNERAGSTAERYHFLVIADFPANFSETALKRLQSILTSGPRCGVHTLIHWDRRQPLPTGLLADELRVSSVCIQGGKDGLILESEGSPANARLTLDPAPPPDLALEFISKVGEASVDSNRVEVPFEFIAPDELWTHDTTAELRVAIGRAGAAKQQILAIGKGTRQHALIAGKTGSGKSTLFHIIVTNLALSCNPHEVEFYLIDFKKGVEFKCYATHRLPHARVVAIESDREFGLSVLQRLDEELRRRGDIFRQLGVQDLPAYQRAAAKSPTKLEPIPRSLLMIDEFQEFFVEDDATAQGASVLLDRIVRQGRAFGIHVILGSQTLGGAYSLARATLGQMAIRIALQCNEADAYLIMDDDNDAPRLLSRPGEGIYNDSAGAVEGNSPFQVCWLSDSERDARLADIRQLAEANPSMDSTPIVFEGNAPADVTENALLERARSNPPTEAPPTARAWLGAPNSIKGPTEIAFHRQSGNNLLIVGQREDAALTLLGTSLVALSAQHPEGTARFVFLHQLPADSPDAKFVAQAASTHADITVADTASLPDVFTTVAEEFVRRRDGGTGGPETFIFIHGLQRFRKLRAADEFDFSSSDTPASPSSQFADIVAEGSGLGIHVLASVDTLNNVNRFLNRKSLAEFEQRVVFQMSANDSASLIDSNQAGNLGLHRAILY